MARPKKVIDPEQVEKLAAIQCSLDEMAAVLKCSSDTLSRRFADVIKRGRENGKCSLKRMQFKKAMDGNITMLIWLGKQYLDQSDKREEVPANQDPNKKSYSAKELVNLIEEARKPEGEKK